MQEARLLPKSARALLTTLASANTDAKLARIDPAAADVLIAADLARRTSEGHLAITDAGRARLLREAASGDIDPFLAQHLALARRVMPTEDGHADVTVDEAESPLAWLARRKGRDGTPLIAAVQFQAGERLRADFTRANLGPRVTSSWDASMAHGRGGQAGQGTYTDAVIAARERLNSALDAVGPEFSGILLDVCCFLKGLEDVGRERGWPPRSAKIVVQLGLDRLARHYGLTEEARGRARAPIRTWADSASEVVVKA